MEKLPRTIAALLAAVLGTSLAARASAQNAPAPGGMQAGGLTPPSTQSGPPAPQPTQPTQTQQRLERASAEDSGRGLEFVYFDVEGGIQHVALQNLHASSDLVPDAVKRSDAGSLLGTAAGVRLLYLTVGPRFRFAHFHDWNLWSLDLEVGWHVPLGNIEPYAMLGAGYSRLARSAEGQVGADGVTVKGYNVRLAGGVDYYVTNVLSVGALVTAELIGLSRGGIAQPGFYAIDSSTLGTGFAGSAVAGLHF
jgi:hypothetical protein